MDFGSRSVEAHDICKVFCGTAESVNSGPTFYRELSLPSGTRPLNCVEYQRLQVTLARLSHRDPGLSSKSPSTATQFLVLLKEVYRWSSMSLFTR